MEAAAASSPEPPVESKTASTVGAVIGMAFLIALIGGAVWAVLHLYPDKITTPKDPTVLESIFAEAIVLFAARLVLFSAGIVLLFTAVYTVASITVRMRRQEWLRRAG